MRLVVKKLFGKYDYDVTFDKKMNVLIGENGTGKSTILKIISCILDNDYIRLSKIKFEYLVFSYEKKIVKIFHKDLTQNDFTKDNNFIFALDEFFNQFEHYDLFKSISNKEFLRLIENNGLFNCDGVFDELLNKIKVFCLKNLKYQSFTINPYDANDYLEIDKSVFGICDSDNDINCSIYNPICNNYNKIKAVYGSNIYLKRLALYYLYLICTTESLSQIWYKINEKFECDSISHVTSYHNFVSFKDENQYKDVTADYEDKINFYSLLSDIILEKANSKDENNVLTEEEKDKIDNIYKEFTKMTSHKDKNTIFRDEILSVENNSIYKVDLDLDAVRINPKDFFEKIYGKNIEIKLDEKHYGSRFTISNKHEILDPLVWFNQTYGDRMYFDNWKEYNYYECYRNIAKNYDKLMACKQNKNYLNFKILFSKYFINKRVDVIGDDVQIYDINTLNKLNEDNLSSGEYKLLRILKMLCFSDENTILLLDEPELSLSIYWQEMLLEDILRYSKAKQIIIATQSPNLINEEQLEYLIEVKKEKGE